jgi:hypothetical protein
VDEPADSDFSQSFEAADDVEESFGDLFDPGSP